MQSTRETVVIGVGNTSRRDDGAGIHFLRRLRARLEGPANVRLIESDGDPAELLASWVGASLAIVVDASSTGVEPGTVTEIDGKAGSNGHGLRHSTHAMGVLEAVQLGKALGRMPSRLKIIAIEGEDFGFGQGVTADVERAVEDLVGRVLEEVIETKMTNDK